MAQEFLHGSDAGAVVDHVGSAAVAEYVWGKPVGHTNREAVLAYDPPHSLTRKATATLVQEHGDLSFSARPDVRGEFASSTWAEPGD